MKGPNPFALWEDDPAALAGRKHEIRSFASFANAAASRQGSVLVVLGGPGAGKSTILRRLRQEAEKEGLEAPYVNAERGEDESAVSDKLYQEMAPGARRRGKAPSTFEELSGKLGAGQGAVFFIDDIDNMKKADEAFRRIVDLLKAKRGKRSIAFVVSSMRQLKALEGPVEHMALKPLEEHEAREMIDKALKKGPPKMGEECFNSLLADTGGNPRLLKRICHDIYGRLRENEKVISKGHYLAYLPQIMGSLSREWFGKMYQETPRAEREILHAIAGEEDGAHVSDIAKRIGKALGPVTALTRRLLDSGQIVRIDRGKYKLFSRLYARYVVQRS